MKKHSPQRRMLYIIMFDSVNMRWGYIFTFYYIINFVHEKELFKSILRCVE